MTSVLFVFLAFIVGVAGTLVSVCEFIFGHIPISAFVASFAAIGLMFAAYYV